ncbi:MAG: Stk1 family PASTA domain-containing Ser/Thr kinase [Nocardioidaceae bacterium]|nr:Stk1 family PASTA domain-containing Ser/Thr kinase [Nocardioidaceae bacterium]
MTAQPPGGAGPVLGGRYEVGALIGRGGMADVRAGQDSRLGRTVAIKRLRSDLASDPTFQARFRREAQSAASLNHPAIVAVYDTGDEVDPDGSHVPYIVMEYVEGETLRQLTRDGRKILPERALEITADVLSALDYSHRAGIVHRDIKPANVMLTPTGRVKVMDFGIARAIADSSSTMTATAAVVGTAQYLSPEQARGEQVDARSDIYSTGCLLFELLTGRPPFVGDSPVSVAYQHVREEPALASSLDPEVSAEIDAIVDKALAKKTSDRYQSAAQMRADIERALAGQAVEAPAAGAAVADEDTPALPMDGAGATAMFDQVEDDRPDEPARRRRGGWLWLLLGLLLLGLLGGVVYLFNQGGGDTASVQVPDVRGDREAQAIAELEGEGLVVRSVNEPADEPAGQVTDQDPPGGDFVDEGATVDLIVSSGPDAVTVPPGLEGASRATAEEILRRAGLTAAIERAPGDEPRNQVIGVSPESGTSVPPDSTVTLTLSEGPVEVPSVVGKNQQTAERLIERAGLQPYATFDSSASADAGTVVAQNPEPGTAVGTGDEVRITVSSRPDETTEPPTTTTEPPTTTTEPPTTTRSPPTTTRPPPNAPRGSGD